MSDVAAADAQWADNARGEYRVAAWSKSPRQMQDEASAMNKACHASLAGPARKHDQPPLLPEPDAPPVRVNSDQIPEGPPWQPAVWKYGPDGLVGQARQELFGDQKDIDGSLRTGAGGGYPDNIAGGGTAPMNESEQLISTAPGPTSDVVGEWKKAMVDLRSAEPLAEAHVNPAP